MLRWIKNKLDSLLLFPQEDPAPKLPPPTKSLDQKLNYIKSQFRESPDVSTRELRIGPGVKPVLPSFLWKEWSTKKRSESE